MKSRPSGAVQLELEFPQLDPDQRPLIATGAYASPLAMIARWQDWPGGQLALMGEKNSGKSRLLRHWALETGAAITTGDALAASSIEDISSLAFVALGVDDADGGKNGLGLLRTLNLCKQRGAPILLTGRNRPVEWYTGPGDLRSRLNSMPVAAIDPPDDLALAARLQDACLRRHLNLPSESIKYLSDRMERSWQAVEWVADQIAKTRGRGDTLKSAQKALDALDGGDPMSADRDQN
jgi:chromosomal replication initiation ATPase DnaA